MTKFKLQFPEEEINNIAMRYDIHGDETMRELQPVVCKRGWLTPSELLAVGAWLRIQGEDLEKLYDTLQKQRQEIVVGTNIALATSDEEERWRELVSLRGVKRGIASSVLHWFAPGRYPVMTTPALSSCFVDDDGDYSFPFWCDYTKFCRDLADKNGVTMRILDRALRQHAEENKG